MAAMVALVWLPRSQVPPLLEAGAVEEVSLLVGLILRAQLLAQVVQAVVVLVGTGPTERVEQ
jgi:hypothetical protein